MPKTWEAFSPSHDALQPDPCSGLIRCLGYLFHRTIPGIFWVFVYLGGVDYVSKWVEVIPYKLADHKVVLKFLKENIFSRFGVPKAIISDGGSHF